MIPIVISMVVHACHKWQTIKQNVTMSVNSEDHTETRKYIICGRISEVWFTGYQDL